jgi:hypothetical protein
MVLRKSAKFHPAKILKFLHYWLVIKLIKILLGVGLRYYKFVPNFLHDHFAVKAPYCTA